MRPAKAPLILWNFEACQSIRTPRSLSPWKPMMKRSLLKAGGIIDIITRRRPKQRFAPEWMKTSIGLENMSDSGSWVRR